jgi:hypothetical protein
MPTEHVDEVGGLLVFSLSSLLEESVRHATFRRILAVCDLWPVATAPRLRPRDRYCDKDYAQAARRDSARAAGRRYQRTRRDARSAPGPTWDVQHAYQHHVDVTIERGSLLIGGHLARDRLPVPPATSSTRIAPTST